MVQGVEEACDGIGVGTECQLLLLSYWEDRFVEGVVAQ